MRMIDTVSFTCDSREVARLQRIPSDAALWNAVHARQGFAIGGRVYRPYGTRQEGETVFVLLAPAEPSLAVAVGL